MDHFAKGIKVVETFLFFSLSLRNDYALKRKAFSITLIDKIQSIDLSFQSFQSVKHPYALIKFNKSIDGSFLKGHELISKLFSNDY